MTELNPYKLERLPQSSDRFSVAEAIQAFGQPDADPKKCKVFPQLVRIEMPYKLRLYSRDATANVTRVSVHGELKPYFEAVYHRVLETYGPKEIVRLGLDVYGGCYDARPIRGGKSWSMHAFAIAQDWLPQENGLNTLFAKSTFARPEYKPFLDIWQECGFLNLGRLPTYARDAMHFERMKTPGGPF